MTKRRAKARRVKKKTSLFSALFRLPHFKLFLSLAILVTLGLAFLSGTNTGKIVLSASTASCTAQGGTCYGGYSCQSNQIQIGGPNSICTTGVCCKKNPVPVPLGKISVNIVVNGNSTLVPEGTVKISTNGGKYALRSFGAGYMDKDNINGYDSTLPVNANPIKIDVTGIWVYNVLFASCVDCLKPANYQKGKETFNGSNNSSIQTNIAGGKTTLVYIKYIKKPTPPTPTSTPTPLGAPTNFKATTFCNGTISSLKLSWNAVTHATGYSYWYDDINGNDRGRDIKGTSVTIPFPDVSLSHAYIPEGKQVDLAVEALGNGPASNPVHILSPVTKKCASTK